MKIIILVSFIFLIHGCVSISETMGNVYNLPSSGSSQFDGTKHIRMSSVSCDNVMFELYQDSLKSEKGVVLLRAGQPNVISNIAKGKSLSIKLNGELYEFETTDTLTEHNKIYLDHGVTMSFSNKSFIVPESFVRKAALAESFLVRVNLLNNTYIEGKCSASTLTEFQNQLKEQGVSYTFTQNDTDTANNNSGQEGFREFVRMMGSKFL